ncbi:MAG TPA: phosphoribosylformylglycinamidine cyclo-ligase [Candidatus Omnitrophota bacterium]|nr:phosphoribosylformylglycinamidine cyclo-ligase [Candidatus Omnitrophota bacterium]HRY85945.1 phosphoribosylformylglycinamidine cyclo-ligase [Candidatus Omnitrophota bacterium]
MSAWTYEKAGVPHLKGDPAYNRKIAGLIRSTHVPGVCGSTLGFASLFDLSKTGIKDPLLVASTDGVGTKLELARLLRKHDTIGIDLVAMCVNDLITSGARPLFFLDYYAAGKFETNVIGEVLRGVTEGCRQAGCALVGGETAIMPGFYSDRKKKLAAQYDIAGFSVGAVARRKVVTGQKIKAGDVLLGIQSSGFHSNGYSLLRKIFTERELQGSIGCKLLTPTIIYVKPVLALLKKLPLKGIINITGGGFYDNLPRVIPSGLGARINNASWEVPKIFRVAQKAGSISSHEMYKTFNMGVGMALILEKRYAAAAQKLLRGFKLNSWIIGKIVKQRGITVL